MFSTGAGWVLASVAAGLVADALFRRSRAARLRRLPEGGGAASTEGFRLVRAEGVEVSDEVFARAAGYAAAEGLDVLELVPARLEVPRALEFLLLVDPAGYRSARMAAGVSAGYATVVSQEVFARAELDRDSGLSADAMEDVAIKLKRYASTKSDFAVVDAAPGRGRSASAHRAILRRRYEAFFPILLTGQALAVAAVAGAAVAAPYAGAAAAAALLLRPLIATVGTPLKPKDRFLPLWPQLSAVFTWLGAVASKNAEVPGLAEARVRYAADIAEGVERFVGERRPDCPWCGSDDLVKFLTSGEYQQCKPGTFRLERCRSCDHIFQNPRLTLDGLDFYYRDFYEGLGMEERETNFRLTGGKLYAGRAKMVRRHAAPKAWLDVGGGIGHFCESARDQFPETRFDALDMGAGIVEAQKRGWVDHAYLGYFIEKAAELTGRYDVISMHHYLEHTLDPHAELDACAKALDTGGLLLIELPDPESRIGRFLGRWWHNWLQPQHLHLIPVGNLERALHDRGLEVVEVERGAAHQGADFFPALGIMMNRLFPDPTSAWQSGRLRSVRTAVRTVAYLAAVPVAVAAIALDVVLASRISRTDKGTNTYRLLARKA